MAISSQHPQFADMLPRWEQMRHTYDGESKVKELAFRYLPATTGQFLDGAFPGGEFNSVGMQAYLAYRDRAVFPELVEEAVEAALGVMHSKPPKFELPSAMEGMLERATVRGESLEMLLRRINEEQLVIGRVGLLGDFHIRGLYQGDPYLSLYCGDKIINWDAAEDQRDMSSLNLVVLDESGPIRDENFEWVNHPSRYRVLILGKPHINEPEGPAVAYRQGVFDDVEFSEDGLSEPKSKSGMFGEVPFVIINSSDIAADVDNPPLYGLSNKCLAIYRTEADYRQSLHMQGQDTLVVIGHTDEKETIRTGAGAKISLPAVTGADAKFIGVDSAGLPEQRAAIENDHARASQKAGQLLDTVSRERESGDALKVRVAARTATLNRVALAGAFGLQEALRKLARWMKLDDAEVKVEPNLDFVNDEMTGKELVDRMAARSMGAPYSLKSIHAGMQQHGMTEMAFEDEVEELRKEEEDGLGQPLGTMNQDGPEDDEDSD